uniref:Uncharacterized protein n=2 Tax=viral metagenome TaxID=1070528 RepID=A0A6M3IPY4_9ZZZZ
MKYETSPLHLCECPLTGEKIDCENCPLNIKNKKPIFDPHHLFEDI